MRKGQSFDCPFPGGEWVREPTAASGGGRKADEGKTTSRQEGIYAVAVCADCFSGPRIASRAHLGVWALHRNQRHFWYFWCQKYIQLLSKG